jgi:hypothetical protein
MSFEAEGFDAFANGADLFFGGVRLHDDEHCWSVLQGWSWGKLVEVES